MGLVFTTFAQCRPAPRRGSSLLWAGLALLAAFGLRQPAMIRAEEAKSSPVASPRFEKEVLPLFRSKCWSCHGSKEPKGQLDLTTAAGAIKGGESGPAIVRGKPDESLLYEKVHGGEMPPPEKKSPLSKAEIEIIRRWIEAGAKAGSAEDDAGGSNSPGLTQHDVLPILMRRCTACHGLRRQEAGLDLHTKAAMLRGGKSGPAIVPGKPGESLLIKRARAGEMPPRQRLVAASVKPIEPAEIDVLARWIAQGAPEVDVRPDVASTTPDPLVTDKDRDFWAFRAPRLPAVPSARGTARVRNPIDRFVLEKLERRGLSLAPEADRLTLLRRASFDLTGLPPEPDEAQAFLADRAPDAYEQMIERLLAAPRYGERWGRYWLDLAGYADSEGKREQDLPRPHAWRYRDYVIQAFAADKPYDRFLLEQIAGDELPESEAVGRFSKPSGASPNGRIGNPSYNPPTEITPEIYDNLVATGFLRMAPDATWANITGYVPDRLEVVADEIDVLGSAVLGLTMKCARCHSHKFDPIPHRDYYRLIAIFKGAYDEYDWLKPDVHPGIGPVSEDVTTGRHLPCVTTAERRAWEEHNAKLQREIDALRANVGHVSNLPGNRQDPLAVERRIRELEAQRLPEPRVQALWDRGDPSPTYIYRRGDFLSPGKLVGPGVPSVLTDGRTPFDVQPPWPGAKQTGRRLAFARWLVKPDHPLTARVMVNRLWKYHFGTGLVTTLANFGKAGARPTHPELLDWLALEFVREGWSIKQMHRLMMTSATYRQSSAVSAVQEKLDPHNALYSRMPLVRLDAEALYDTLLLAAGRLDERRFGPGDRVEVRGDGLVTPVGTATGWRRLIYVEQRRKQIPTHLENFDFPQMNPNCIERRDSTVAPQALHLMNNGMVQHLAEHFAERVRSEAGREPARQIERAYWIALSRPPNEEERQVSREALAQLTDQWAKRLRLGKGEKPAQKALAAFCHALVNSGSFVYVD